MEARFGTPHPELEGFKEPNPSFGWLVDGFFRLHKRRQLGEMGVQPLGLRDITEFADQVIRVREDLRALFIRTMEATDNGVLYDNYARASQKMEELQKSSKKSKGRK